MDAPDLSTVVGAGGAVTVGGSLVAWFVKLQIKRVLDAIERWPNDLNGLGQKVRDMQASLDERHQRADSEIKIELARLDERIKFLERPK